MIRFVFAVVLGFLAVSFANAEEGAGSAPPIPVYDKADSGQDLKAEDKTSAASPAPEAKPSQELQRTPAPEQTEAPAEPAAVSTPTITPIIKEEPKASAPAPAEAKPIGCVAALEPLLKFYEKELETTQKLIDRWNDRLKSLDERGERIAGEMDDLTKSLEEKKSEDPKKNKKEIRRIENQMDRLRKELKSISKEFSRECKELAAEVKEVGKENAAALKERYGEVYNDILSDKKGD